MECDTEALLDVCEQGGLAPRNRGRFPGCVGGCKNTYMEDDGIVCKDCGVIRPLVPGETRGRPEYDKERREKNEQDRREPQQHIEASGTMTRVVWTPPAGNCRACITRAVAVVADNRLAAQFVCKLVAHWKRSGGVADKRKQDLEFIATELQVRMEMCNLNAFNGRANRQALRNEVQTVRNLGDLCSGGSAINEFKRFLRDAFSDVATQDTFKKKVEAAREKCNSLKTRCEKVGKSAEAFLPPHGYRPGTLNPIIKTLLKGEAPNAGTPELNARLKIRAGTRMQTVPESILEAIVEDNRSTEVVRKVVNRLMTSRSVVPLLEAVTKDEATGGLNKRIYQGAVCFPRKTPGKWRWLTAHRLCCDDADCKQTMCLSFAGDSGMENLETMWNVQTRLLGAFAVGLSNRPELGKDEGMRLVEKASKELFLASPFFSRRVSEFVNAASAFMASHDKTLLELVEARKDAKHDLSVQSLAMALGFWLLYFEPCFAPLDALFEDDRADRDSTSVLNAFVRKCTERHEAFRSEKGNATVDAALCYRALQYSIALEKQEDGFEAFAKTTACGAPYPAPPPAIFKKEVDIDRFAKRVSECLELARSSARAGTGHDNALVKAVEKTSLTFDGLMDCVAKNGLPTGCQEETLDDLKTRAEDLAKRDLLKVASAAAERLEASCPGFWGHLWHKVPSLAQDSWSARATGYHPAAGLFKQLDDTPHRYEPDSAEPTRRSGLTLPGVPLSEQDFAPVLLPIGSKDTDEMQKLLDMEVALSVLMHGERIDQPAFVGKRIPEPPSTPSVDIAVARLARAREEERAKMSPREKRQAPPLRASVLKLLEHTGGDKSFPASLLEFCDLLAVRAMQMEIHNAMPSESVHECPVVECANRYFDDPYTRRAEKLHELRLRHEVGRLVREKAGRSDFDPTAWPQSERDHDAHEYYHSGGATIDVYERGLELRATLSGQKRACLNDYTRQVASTAMRGYQLLQCLTGRAWLGEGGDPANTSKATEIGNCIAQGDTTVIESILNAVDEFSRHKTALRDASAGYAESSGTSTRRKGERDCAAFVTQPIHPSFFEGLVWANFDRVSGLIRKEVATVEKDADRNFLVIRSVERSATVECSAKLQREYIERNQKVRNEWNALDDLRKRNLSLIATSLDIKGLTAFDLFCMDGVAAVLAGVHVKESVDPRKLFETTYCRTNNRKTVSETHCNRMFSQLQRWVLALNANRCSLADIPSVYRQPVFVEFLCLVGGYYGTMRERRAAEKIRLARFDFLTRRFATEQRFLDDDVAPPEPAIAEDREDADERARRARARAEAEEQVAASRARDGPRTRQEKRKDLIFTMGGV